ncbi:hypothetical protein [Natrinema versiforme]|uniref:Uncharacterized protein n=1 Tax=Natrinema versiforme TaxID=88724 RepID=A0A4P8WNC7_9EURY|nr:hypothetical protein [Natrinema versiforme]QCS43903.1 hypothetical protein FEJ81_16685 [Natrinema versiforme]
MIDDIHNLLLVLFMAMPMLGMSKESGGSGGLGRSMSYLRDEVEAKENDIYEFAVKIRDETVIRHLSDAKRSWENQKDWLGTDKIFENTKQYKSIVKKHTTINITDEAYSSSRWKITKYITSTAEKPSAKNLKLVKWLMDFADSTALEDVTQIYMTGIQGKGKTFLAFLIAELWLFMNEDGVVLTNVKGVSNTVHVGSMDELDEWIESNPNKVFFFVFDEANKHASGTGGDAQKVQNQFFPLVTFLRKKGGNYIIIGHVPKDVHRWVRQLCVYVHKTGRKTAEIYEGLEDNGEPKEHMKTLRAIPVPTTLVPDTEDETEWEWSDGQTSVCFGENKEGERCGSIVETEYGEEKEFFCDSHKHQEEPHEDVYPHELLDTPYEEYVDEDVLGEIRDTEDEYEPLPLPPAPEVEPELAEQVRKEAEEEAAQESTEELQEDAEEKETIDENPTPQNTTDDSRGRVEHDEASEETTDDEDLLEQVPEKYWTKVTERTRFTEEDVDEFEQLEQLLGDRDYQRLKSKLDA